MTELYRDRRFYFIIAANLLSSIGSGITMVAIPWLLVSDGQGATIFGYVTIVMTIINFIMTPFIGQWVDRFPRKKLLMTGEIVGFLVILLFALLGLFGIDYTNWHYMILYGTGSFYYNLFYPGMFALNQEIFPKSAYKTLNGAMEIQGQLSSVIAGALAALMLGKVSLEWLLLFDAATYISAYLFFAAIPYTPKRNPMPNGDSFWIKLTEGYRFIEKQPKLFLFLLASFMPFIGVMVTNYLFPVYLTSVLKVDGSVYGAQSMVYGIGAVLAGLFIPLVSNKLGNMNSILLTTLIYTIGISFIIFTKVVPIYLFIIILLAFGNAGTRVARNSYMMDTVPNSIIGRVDSLFRTIGLGIRVILLSAFTMINALLNVQYSFYILSGLLILSVVILYWVKISLFKQKEIIFNGIRQH
jgi:MFS family permease